MKLQIVLTLFFIMSGWSQTYLGVGGGTSFGTGEKPNAEFTFGWRAELQHMFALQEAGQHIGFRVAAASYSGTLKDYSRIGSSLNMIQTEIQFGVIWQFLAFRKHHISVGAGYVISNTEVEDRIIGSTHTDGGYYIGLEDKIKLTEYYGIEGALRYYSSEVEANFGRIDLSGIRLDLTFWLNFAS